MGSQLSNDPRKKEKDYLDEQPYAAWGWLAVMSILVCGILIVILKLGG